LCISWITKCLTILFYSFRAYSMTILSQKDCVVHCLSWVHITKLFIFITNGSAEKGVNSFYGDAYLKDQTLFNIFDLYFNKETQHEETVREISL